MAYERTMPRCKWDECAGNENGQCVVLVSNTFTKPCPFFKTREQVEKEHEYVRQRLADINGTSDGGELE